jgi:hypothetical protein
MSSEEEIEPDAFQVERSEAFTDFVSAERFKGYTLTKGMSVEPLFSAETIKDQLKKIQHNTHKGRQIDGQDFVSEDEYSGYEAAISDLIEVFSHEH